MEKARPRGQPTVTAKGAARRARPSWPVVWSAVLFAVVLALCVASVPLAGLAHQGSGARLGNSVASALLVVVLAGVGLLVARHEPRNPIGWLLLGSGACFALQSGASDYSLAAYLVRPGRLPLGWLAVLLQPSWAPAIVLLALTVVLFPDGRLASRRWRWPVRLSLAVSALWVGGAFAIAATAIIGHRIRIASSGDLDILDHPTGAAALWGVVQNVFFTLLVAGLVACVIQQAASYRRASGERRQQLKWLTAGAAITGICGMASIWVPLGGPGLQQLANDALTAGVAALPASMGVAIMKYRLYDIDRIISRTLAYAIVTGLLVGVYTGLVLMATEVLRFHSAVAVAAATLGAAALFNPLRRRVQKMVDRRFNRARYDADRIIAAFAARLKDAVNLDAVQADLASSVQQALEPTHVSVWLQAAGRQ